MQKKKRSRKNQSLPNLKGKPKIQVQVEKKEIRLRALQIFFVTTLYISCEETNYVHCSFSETRDARLVAQMIIVEGQKKILIEF